MLTSATSHQAAEVVITNSGQAYWVNSTLPELSGGQTYQLWALVNGKAVSIGLIGRDPTAYAAFTVEIGSSALMVTAEPQGGTPQPTTKVLVQETI